MTFIVPAVCVILTFWITFAVVYIMVKNQLAPIVRSVRRLEKRMSGGNTTEDFGHYAGQYPPAPPPQPHVKYRTVEQGIRPGWEKQ